MQESLLYRPTAEVISNIAQPIGPRNFYLASFTFDGSYHLPFDEQDEDNSWLENLHPFERGEVASLGWLDEARKKIRLDEGGYIGIISRVMFSGGFAHIPMVDFDLKNNKELDIASVKSVLTDLCLPNGYVASSGKGYHYIGSRFMSEQGFNQALKQLRKLKRSSGVDKKWLELTEERGFFTLRLTSGADKPNVPIVVGFHYLKGRPAEIGTPWNICATRYGASINAYTLEGWWELQQALYN